MDLTRPLDVINLLAGAFLAHLLPYLKKKFDYFREQLLRSVAKVDITTPLGRRAFDASMEREVYGRLPEEIKNLPSEIEQWLREAAKTEEWHEIYLVSRSGFRLRKREVNGVLYASLYPLYSSGDYKGPMCVVNVLVAKKGLNLDQAMAVETKLWSRLEREAKKLLKGERVNHYFFEVLDPNCPIESCEFDKKDEQDRRREYLSFLKKINAKQIQTEYWILDVKERIEIPANLWDLGPTGHDDGPNALNFMYGFHYFHEYKFGVELTNIKDLAARVEYLRNLIKRTSSSAAPPSATD